MVMLAAVFSRAVVGDVGIDGVDGVCIVIAVMFLIMVKTVLGMNSVIVLLLMVVVIL